MKIYFYLLALIFFYLGAGVFFSNVDLKIVLERNDISIDSNKEFYDYAGVINVHSIKSSGGSSIQEIIKLANEIGLDFIFFNEEIPLGRKEPPAINFGKLSVYYGFEMPYKNTSILFADRVNKRTFTSNSEIQIFLSDYFENGGDELVVLAHPDKPGFSWNDEVPKELTGIEVLNLREIWRSAWQKRKLSFFKALVFYPFNPNLFFLNIYSESATSTGLWDEWNKKANIYGYMGSDVTSKLKIGKKSLRFPGYKNIFSMSQNHVVVEEELTQANQDEKILQALNAGSAYFSLDIFGNPEGFVFYALDTNQNKRMMGSEINFEKVNKLVVELPVTKTDVKTLLIKDSKVILEETGSFEFSPKDPGVYRVEVQVSPKFPIFREQKWLPWVFSNPIRIVTKEF